MSETPEPIVEIQDLYHNYKSHQALCGVTFQVHQGSIHGFVGPNGAGKTTTLKILATLLRPQHGRVRMFGEDLAAHYKTLRRLIGFMPDHFSMYRQMSVQEYLDFFAAAYGLDFAGRTRTLHDVLALTDMESRRHDMIKGLSRGMQQRISLARVLVHDPSLLLLDEPASGLDPRARVELMEILKELRRMGKTIFISSHILSELAQLCDSVSILDRGRIRYSGSMQGLVQRDGPLQEYLLQLAQEHPPVEAALRSVPGVEDIARVDGEPRYRIRFHRERTDTNALLRAILESGGRIAGFQEDVRQLNEAFLDLTEPGVPPPVPAPPPVPPLSTGRESAP
jgi:ABC-2 type transport system ATP-binding protein